MQEATNKAIGIGEAIINWFQSFSPYQLLCLLVCAAAVFLTLKLAGKTLGIVLKIVAVLSAVSFLFPGIYRTFIAWVMGVVA